MGLFCIFAMTKILSEGLDFSTFVLTRQRHMTRVVVIGCWQFGFGVFHRLYMSNIANVNPVVKRKRAVHPGGSTRQPTASTRAQYLVPVLSLYFLWCVRSRQSYGALLSLSDAPFSTVGRFVVHFIDLMHLRPMISNCGKFSWKSMKYSAFLNLLFPSI